MILQAIVGLVVTGATFVIVEIIFDRLSGRRKRGQIDALVDELLVSAAELGWQPPLPPPPPVLTVEQKVDALYQIIKRQDQFQFVSNLAWGLFGIFGGYLAGRFLPH